MRKGIMLANPFEIKRLQKWKPPYIIQPKLDGERCRAVFDADGVLTLLTSEENIIVSVPHIERELLSLGLRNMELDGELYTHGMGFDDIRSRVSRTINLHNDYEATQFHMFDLVYNDNMAMKQIDRVFKLMELKSSTKNNSAVEVVYTELVDDEEEILSYMEDFISDGYEGFILREKSGLYERKRSTNMMKFKPRKEDIYTITGWKEEMSISGEPKNTLGALVCVSQSGEHTFAVGSGFTNTQRAELWFRRNMLIGKQVMVKYQHLTPGKGVPRFPIFSQIVWE